MTPRWLIFHIVTVAAVIACVVLGWWQLNIYRESQATLDVRDSEPVSLETLVTPGEPLGDSVDRPATAAGHYLYDHQLSVPGRVKDGVLGSYSVTPFRTESGTVVPVLRGWVAGTHTTNPEPKTEVTITGILQDPETADDAVTDSSKISDGEIAFISPEQILNKTTLPRETSVEGYLVLQSETPQAHSAPAVVDTNDVAPIRNVQPWQNFSYWAQWWVFGAAAVLFWFSALRSAVRRKDA